MSCSAGRERFDARIWAGGGRRWGGYLLAQQLVAAGELVLDVPATLAARVRVLGRPVEQDRRVTTAIRSRRGAARTEASGCRPGGSRDACCGCWRAQQGARQRPHPHRVSASCAAGRVGARAESPSNSRPIAPRRLLAERDTVASPWKRRATRWPSNISRTCAASTSGCAPPSGASPTRSRPLARPPLRCSASARSAPAIAVGQTRDISRFATRDRFAAYNAPLHRGRLRATACIACRGAGTAN